MHRMDNSKISVFMYLWFILYHISSRNSTASNKERSGHDIIYSITLASAKSQKNHKEKKCCQSGQSCSQTSQCGPSEYKSKTLVLEPAHPKITDTSHDLPVYSEQRTPQVTGHLILWRCYSNCLHLKITCLHILNKGHWESQCKSL